MSKKKNNISFETERVARLMYRGKIKPGQVDQESVRLMAHELMNAVLGGYTGTSYGFKEIDPDTHDYQMLSQLEDNVHIFSGFKNYRELQEISALLVSNGTAVPFTKFLKGVQEIEKTYNKIYLKAEYDLARQSAQQAAEWQRIQEDKDIFPNLQYDAVLDGHETKLCHGLDGKIYPVDHVFWKTYYPPNHWHCRSFAKSVGEDEEQSVYEPGLLPENAPMFQNNVGISGEIFPDTHPYFDIPGNEAALVQDKIKMLIPGRWENYKEFKLKKADPDYTNTEFHSDSGGFSTTHIRHGKSEKAKNELIAKAMMKQGFGVELQERLNIPGQKTADSIIHPAGKEWELNHLDKFTNLATAVQGAVRKSKGQARNIVLFIEQNAVGSQINRGLVNAVRWDNPVEIKRVLIITKTKNLMLTREEIISGRAAQLLSDSF